MRQNKLTYMLRTRSELKGIAEIAIKTLPMEYSMERLRIVLNSYYYKR